MHNIRNLARQIISGLNRSYTCLLASKSSDFASSSKIVIEVLSSTPVYIGDFVYSKLSPFYRSHLNFLGSDDFANITYWEVV